MEKRVPGKKALVSTIAHHLIVRVWSQFPFVTFSSAGGLCQSSTEALSLLFKSKHSIIKLIVCFFALGAVGYIKY